MDYLFGILDAARIARPPQLGQIEELVRACMGHADVHYVPPEAYPIDSHGECVIKALQGAQAGNWQLVIDELRHDG
jgi:hypothetical protein